MQDNIPDALITAFERQYDSSWNDPKLRNERLAMRYGWAAAMEAKPCLHQIQEPAPATAMDALREAEAALEVAMARILKADPSHSICVTSEAKALVAVRAALAAPAPMLVAQPQLHAALFAARGALQHMKEGGKPTQSLLNEAIAAIDSVAVTQAAPAAVAVPDEREALQDGEWYWIEKEGWHGNPPTIAPALYKAECDAWYSFAFAGIPTRQLKVLEPCLLQARAALAATPAAAPVVLPEPVPTPCRSMFATQREYADAMAQHRKNWAEIEAERGMLATGGQAQAVEQAPVLYVSKGQLDNHRDPDGPDSANAGRYLPCRITPAGKFTTPLFAAPQAQAVEVDDHMALAFHHAITDGAIGQDDLNEIKIGLRAVLANLHAPQAQADARDAELLDFLEANAASLTLEDGLWEIVVRGKTMNWATDGKTAREAIAAAKEQEQ